MDRYRQRAYRLVAGLAHPGPPDAPYDAAPAERNHARLLREALLQQSAQGSGVRHRVHIPYTLYRIPVQRPLAPFQHGLQHRLYLVRDRNGRAHRNLRPGRGVYGYGGERLHPGTRDALRHLRRDRVRSQRQRRLHRCAGDPFTCPVRGGARSQRRLRVVPGPSAHLSAGRRAADITGYLGTAADGR